MQDIYEPLCDPFESSFENAFDKIDDFDLDESDLAEWLDDKYEPKLDLSEDIALNKIDLIDDSTVINIHMFDNEESTHRQLKRKISSKPHAHKRSRKAKVSPKRNIRSSKKYHQTMKASRFVSSVSEDNEYKNAMSRIVSELSQVASVESSPPPSASTLSSFVGLLAGKRSSLTVDLEHSRRQLQSYMSLMLSHGTL